MGNVCRVSSPSVTFGDTFPWRGRIIAFDLSEGRAHTEREDLTQIVPVDVDDVAVLDRHALRGERAGPEQREGKQPKQFHLAGRMDVFCVSG